MGWLGQRDAFGDSQQRVAAGRLGMWLFLLTLGVLFASGVFAFLVVRLEASPSAPWRTADSPGLPWVLLLSTAVLAASSVTMTRATRALATDDRHALRVWINRTLLLAIGFLLAQSIAWVQMWRAGAPITSGLYAWTFYVFTALHALHVIGGIVPMAVVARRARGGVYSRRAGAGVEYCAMYWHFLFAVWIALYAMLLIGAAG